MADFFSYAFIIGAAQGLLLAIFLFRKRENIIANRFLAVTLIFFTVDLILEAAAATGEIRKYPALIGIMQSLPYLYGPSIYLYVLFITKASGKFNFKYLFHYLPFILVQIYGLFYFYFESASYQINVVYVISELPWHVLMISYITPIYGGIYILLAIYQSYKFVTRLKNNFSSIDKHNFSWLKFLVVGAVLLWITSIIMNIIQIIYGNEIRPELVSYLFISIFIYAIAYKALKQPEPTIEFSLEQSESQPNNIKSYKKSGLSEENASIYIEKLVRLMEEQMPYKNDKLSLSELSEMLDISSHNLSEIINTYMKKNFYDFVNSYRVEEVKRLIKNDNENKFSIAAIGYDAGFNSKSAFYTAFKKVTGKTPAQYRSQSNNL